MKATDRRKKPSTGIKVNQSQVPFVGRGLVTPSGTAIQQRGRPSFRYRVCIPRPILVCQVEATQISLALFDRDLILRGLETETFGGIGSLTDGLKAIIKVVGRLKTSVPKSTLIPSELALELNAIRLDQNRLVSSVLPWAELSFEQRLSEKLGMTVRSIPPFAQLIAEKQKMHILTAKSIIRFQVSDGISAHAAFGGQNYQGHSSLAGQLGHIFVDSGGPLCACGRRGCLEAYCGGPALHRQLIQEMSSGVATIMKYEKIAQSSPRGSIDCVWEAWKNGDSYARDFMRRVFERLAWSLGIVMDLIDPELIVACGYVLANRPDWVEEIHQKAQQWTLYAPARRIPLVMGQATSEDELRVAGTLYFYPYDG